MPTPTKQTDLLNRICGFTFPKHTWAHVNLDAQARIDWPYQIENKLLDPKICAKWVEGLAERNNADFIFGGFLENRSYLWRDTYLHSYGSTGGPIHLGVDINVPEHCAVYCPVAAKIIHVLDDEEYHGWGGRIVVETAEKQYLLFAHLEFDTPLTIGKMLRANTCIGSVAKAEKNGGWFPHLHLQKFNNRGQINDSLDGYGNRETAKLFSDPLEL